MTPIQCWQAFLETLWILAPPTPYEWLCGCTESPPEPSTKPARAVQLDEALAEELCELMPLPALTDAVQGWLMSADPPIDVITFCNIGPRKRPSTFVP